MTTKLIMEVTCMCNAMDDRFALLAVDMDMGSVADDDNALP